MDDTETLKIIIFIAGLIFAAGTIVATHVGHGRQIRALWAKLDRHERRAENRYRQILIILTTLAKSGNPREDKDALNLIMQLKNGDEEQS